MTELSKHLINTSSNGDSYRTEDQTESQIKRNRYKLNKKLRQEFLTFGLSILGLCYTAETPSGNVLAAFVTERKCHINC